MWDVNLIPTAKRPFMIGRILQFLVKIGSYLLIFKDFSDKIVIPELKATSN